MATGPTTPTGFKQQINAKLAELNQLLRDAYDKADVYSSVEDKSETTDQKLPMLQLQINLGVFKREGERPDPAAMPAGVEKI